VTSNLRNITLDHVTPRKGQTAYDRRDNLVLACKRCNSAKADKPFLMYLLAQRARAINLALYGQHLSDGILDIVRPLAGEISALPARLEMRPGTHAERQPPGYASRPRVRYGDDDEDSPYSDSPYRATA
jgi:HNH endonuclease